MKPRSMWMTAAAVTLLVIIALAIWATGFFDDDEPSQPIVEADEETEIEVDLEDSPAWASVAVGEGHSCAIHSSGSLWCWGNNAFGQVGDGTRTGRDAPVQISDSLDWTAVAASTTHSCGTREDGSLYCWGRNDHGQFGNGTRDDYPAPVAMRAGDSGPWTALSAGTSHGCGIRQQQAFCWGDNQRGQLGDETNESQASPVAVHGEGRWKTLSAATYYTCGIQEEGSLWCWGGSDREHPIEPNSTPTRLGEHMDWVEVAAGDFHTCARRSGGELHCWGNAAGRRLPDKEDWDMHPFSDEPSTDEKWAAISTRFRTTCGITDEGAISCWGDPDQGLQEPSTEISDWAAIDIGRDLGCAIRQGGQLYCWSGPSLGEPIGSPHSLKAAQAGADAEVGASDSDLQESSAETKEPRPVEFFTAQDKTISWYRVDQEGVERLREFELPYSVESLAWVPGRGLAMTILGQSEDATQFCSEMAQGCRPRTLLLLSHDDLHGDPQTFPLPRDIYWARIGRLEMPGLQDNATLRATTDGELWLARCHGGYEKEGCTLSSSMRLFPSPEQSDKRYYDVATDTPSWEPVPFGESAEKPAGVDLLVSDDRVLCLSSKGDFLLFPGPDDLYTYFHGAQWVSYDPAIFSTWMVLDAGNSDNPEGLRPRANLYHPCTEELSGWSPRFGPEGVFVISNLDSNLDTVQEIYFHGESVELLQTSRLVFRPLDEEPAADPIDMEFAVELPGALEESPFADATTLYERSQEAWTMFPHTTPASACERGTYPVTNSGPTMARLYCHLRNFGTLKTLEAAIGMPVFLAGPHVDGKMDLSSSDSFGHYNPQFVQTLHLWTLSVLKDSAFLEATRPNFEQYIEPLAKAYDDAYQSLLADEENYQAAQQAYQESLSAESWRDRFQSREFSDEHSNAVRFWTRRGIDGTHEFFATGLEMLRDAYR